MRRMTFFVLSILAVSLVPVSTASAALINVDALLNSSSGTGTPVLTGIILAPGDHLVITVAENDCWSAGAADRQTNANGLVGLTTNSCRPIATTNYGTWTQAGATFPFASLIGRIDLGPYFLIGTSFDAIVSDAGELTLRFWDSNNFDNFGFITADITVEPAAVPEPATILLTGLGLAVAAARRRQRVA